MTWAQQTFTKAARAATISVLLAALGTVSLTPAYAAVTKKTHAKTSAKAPAPTQTTTTPTTPGTTDNSLRAPTKTEQAAIDRYRATLTPVIDSLAGADWKEDMGGRYDIGAGVKVLKHPDGLPMAFDATIGRFYDIKPDSDRYNRIVAPYETKARTLNDQLQAATDDTVRSKLADELASLPGGDAVTAQHVYIATGYNVTNLTPSPDFPQAVAMKVPGIAVIYELKPDQVPAGKGYILLFGDWDKATWDAAHGYLHYNFKNKVGTPHIENAIMIIQGPDDYIQSLLTTTDWTRVAAGLTP